MLVGKAELFRTPNGGAEIGGRVAPWSVWIDGRSLLFSTLNEEPRSAMSYRRVVVFATIQSLIVFKTSGEIVSSIIVYSDNAPVGLVWNR